MATAQDVVNWLVELGCTSVHPVTVRIGDQAMAGAEYVNSQPKEPMGAMTGKIDTRPRLYVIGRHPAIYRKSNRWVEKQKVCYRWEGDSQDWYVAAYYPQHNKRQDPKFAHCHPFGKTVLFCRWDSKVCNGSIDQYENKPYTRVPMDVKYHD